MKQPHTESSVDHTDDQQNTGNHKKPMAEDAGGADRFGGTRAGAENVEKKAAVPDDAKMSPDGGIIRTSAERANEVTSESAARGREETHPAERGAARDERNRL